MKITAYTSQDFLNTRVYETDYILANVPPEEMDDETREEMRNGSRPLLSFYDIKSDKWVALPIEFVIEISQFR